MAQAVVATAFGGPEVLKLVDKDVPAPSAGHVTIRVKASGINPSDYKTYGGMFGADESKLPLPIGNEVAGIVTAVGEDAVGPSGPISVGDEVVGYRVIGGYSTELNAKASNVLPKPGPLTWAQSANLLLTGTTAVHLLETVGVQSGETLLVHGASGAVGTIAIQLAVARGMRVIGTASSKNFDVIRRFGGEPVVYGDGLEERVRALAPNGVDAALDTIGTDEALDVSVTLVTNRDRIATINGFKHGAELGIRLLGASPGADPGTELRNAARLELIRLAQDGKLDVVVAKTFALDDFLAAQELLLSGHPGGKLAYVS